MFGPKSIVLGERFLSLAQYLVFPRLEWCFFFFFSPLGQASSTSRRAVLWQDLGSASLEHWEQVSWPLVAFEIEYQ